jgi:hypothetical protein
MPDRVPSEFLGRARDLRRRLAACEATVEPAMHEALAQLQRRLKRYPDRPLRRELLIDAARDWRQLPPFSRVKCSIDIREARQPMFADVRLSPSAYKGLDWVGDAEPGLAVMLIEAGIANGTMMLVATPVAIVLLHCLARRYQRAPARADDATIIVEIGKLTFGYSQLAPGGGDFRFAVPGGEWRGHIVETKAGNVLLVARTFLDAGSSRLAA